MTKIASPDDPVVITYADALAALTQATAVRVAAEQRVADAQFALAEAQAAETAATAAHDTARAALATGLSSP